MKTVFNSSNRPMYYPYPVQKTQKQNRKKRRYSATPTPEQTQKLNAAQQLALRYQYKPKAILSEILIAAGFPTPTDSRIYRSGGVGSFHWLPRKKCYRLQLAASHVHIHQNFMPYALCIDIYWKNVYITSFLEVGILDTLLWLQVL